MFGHFQYFLNFGIYFISLTKFYYMLFFFTSSFTRKHLRYLLQERRWKNRMEKFVAKDKEGHDKEDILKKRLRRL